MFEDLPGHDKVAKKEYELEDTAGMAVISADNWYARVTAGARIVMSILFQLASMAKALDAQICPRCQTVNSEPNLQQGMTEWLVTPARLRVMLIVNVSPEQLQLQTCL